MVNVEQLREDIRKHFTRTLFRLETLDQYEVISDGSDVARYLVGEQFVGAEMMPHDRVSRYRAARDAAWYAAEPFDSYWAAHPQHRRDAPTG